MGIKKQSWHELASGNCPKCGSPLMQDMFGAGFVGCACGFNLDEYTKDLLVKRDFHEQLPDDKD